MKIRLYFTLLLMGFTSLLAQTLLIREFLIGFYGNELIIGLILANWVILVAIGSISLSRPSLKTKRPIIIYASLQAAIALYLPVNIFLIRNVKNLLGLNLGEGVGILTAGLSSFFILAPLSIFIGAQFPLGCRILSDYSKKPLEATGKVYILEAIGYIFAGPILTYIFITKLNAFQIVLLLGSINLLCGLLLLKYEKGDTFKNLLSVILALGLGLVIIMLSVFSTRINSLSINKEWRKQKVVEYRNSIYSNLVVTESHKQYTFYSDGVPIITTPLPDIEFTEEFVHFTCLSHANPKELLILSGGVGGVIKEILKHPINRVDYAELDPLLINLIKKYPTPITQEELSDPRLNIKYIDGRRYVHLTNSSYDVILVNLPMPSTLQLNRFFTKEFFSSIKSILKESGVFGFRLPGSLSYIGEDLRNLNGSILNTLQSEFPFVKVIPGDYNLYLASKNNFEINPEIFISRLKERSIESHLLSGPYLNYRLDPAWFKWFKNSMGEISQIRKNLDLLPSAVFYSISYWNAQFSQKVENFFRYLDKLNFRVLISVILLLGLCLLIFERAFTKLKKMSIGFAIATTGFVGMAINLIIIFAYQSFYGFVFYHLALLFTAFMAGLGLGGWLITRNLFRIKKELLFFLIIELIILGFSLLLVPLFIYLDKFPAGNLSFIFFLLSAMIGFLVGSEFPLANKIYWQDKTSFNSSAGILYFLDLLGAFAANLIVSVALVPVIGIVKTCILLMVLKAISLALIGNPFKQI